MSVTTDFVPDLLRRLRARSGLSMDALAQAAGFRRASSIQRYMNPDQYGGGYLRRDLVARLADALVGWGKPPIREEEVWALAGPEFEARSARTVGVDPAISARLLRLFADALSAKPVVQKQIADLIEPQLEAYSKTRAISTKHES